MEYKIKVSGDDLAQYLYSSVNKMFEMYSHLQGLARPRLENGHIGWYIEDAEEFIKHLTRIVEDTDGMSSL